MKRTLGTCYYPEHWPQDQWAKDADRMVASGLTWVRIGEFAWSKLEPTRGHFEWAWLDLAIEILGKAGLKIVLGTPTATPPRWMLDRYPDMLAKDANGHPRKFGSRRHYCFSHEDYKSECRRIVDLLGQRYGQNPYVAAWQTDNEYGCHDTTLSYSDAARDAFRIWLAARYTTVEALNLAWGNVFWSMEYNSFAQIDLPNLTVTEANPSHILAFRRFSSDQVVAFNRLQTRILRQHTKAPLTHNYMGRVTDFDHFDVGKDLDIASWDSYPLGFLEDRVGADDAMIRKYAHQGDPDFQAFHHDLYRAVGRGRMWVMEQQPGPVNWAPHNPAPLPGMVRLWSWEAFAHGAEAVCYFRWRQAPFAQEQMHSGLLRPDSEDAPAMGEIRTLAAEINHSPNIGLKPAPIALLFDYDAESHWATQPHGAGLSYFRLVFDTYRAMRKLGLSIDILPVTSRNFAQYRLIAAPGLMHMSDNLKAALSLSGAAVLLGPRSGARTNEMAMPVPLAPAFPELDLKVSFVESLREDMPVALENGGFLTGYREELDTGAEVLEATQDHKPVVVQSGKITYIGAMLDGESLQRVLKGACELAVITTLPLPDGVRIRDTETERVVFNHNAHSTFFEGIQIKAAGILRVDSFA